MQSAAVPTLWWITLFVSVPRVRFWVRIRVRVRVSYRVRVRVRLSSCGVLQHVCPAALCDKC